MARINLLPWRAERRKARQKEFGAMLGLSALAAAALSFLIVFYYSNEISGQQKRNSFLDGQIAEVDKKIAEIEELDKKKAKLLARKEVIEKLQSNRSQMVHLFDSLVRTIPDGAVLTAIKQDAETLTLEGRAQSNARVSTYMRNLEVSGWMSKPDLTIIEAKDGGGKGLPYEFKLTVKLANPNAPKDEDGDGIPDAPAAPAEAAAATAPGAAPAAGTAAPAPAPAAPAGNAAAAAPGSAPAAPAAAKPGQAPAAPAQPPAAKPAAAPAKPAAPAAAPTKTGAAS
ncbi:type IV pilus assembly protein PilN [Lysobacter sp. yr284]|uniref:PilN domain-containing protein n=1 Tax=Lysobacter sp. yr284 TaxID=1761791 RepID=UPI0008952319|nr:PilN domain-containing protein [Lysobacter sp. yr284]SDZ25330.1 type IV pilus assembly protein PilN [Lysobacter sp. yr284]